MSAIIDRDFRLHLKLADRNYSNVGGGSNGTAHATLEPSEMAIVGITEQDLPITGAEDRGLMPIKVFNREELLRHVYNLGVEIADKLEQQGWLTTNQLRQKRRLSDAGNKGLPPIE